ncbi:thioredoxin fold domain-containing protein [Dictyostelium discoideum AX4]|uniref:Thioredoxin fold domain-containing protein n=1 Tax=Dictyostelium discoideum TaxID=44689 RepID=C7G009_DICDI|nr:thioredoxin fold domain-containing protein [Dictyostelium discoideum AX4]EEU04109.1 thioredoxin fold domain-containing protein [Dictyostelium discoideum AX4]|eukprot:XP_002649161.1 thioredoxin fold domain-containing protein [Dictyostelium discoideum AX4]
MNLILNGNWLVKFGAGWSGHCKKLQPVLENLAQHYNSDNENSKVKVAQVHCEEYESICIKYNIIGYPSLVFFDEGEIKHYRGPRLFENFKEAIDKHLNKEFVAFSQNQPSKIIVITNENLDLLLTGNWLVKFGAAWSLHCKKLQPVLENLAQHYNSDNENSKVKVAQVHCEEDNSICKKYNITGYPSLVFFNEGQIKHYTGPRQFENFKEAIDKHFKYGVKWSGHCKKFQPVLENLAQHYNSDIENSKIKVAQVHCEGDDSICKKYNITGYPSLVFFDEGETKPYRGLREFDKIKEATDKHFK